MYTTRDIRICVYVYVYIYMCANILINICIYTHIYIYTMVFDYTCKYVIYIAVYMYIFTDICIYIHTPYIHMRNRTFINMHINICTYSTLG